MLKLRPAIERGQTTIDWLDSRHTFSFGGYREPNHQGFRSLLVINDDRVAPGGGFAPHSHRDMEIITYVLEGALEHKDSLGNGSVIYPGDIQRMSAGRGIQHSEYNHSQTEPVHFLQIWITPEETDLTPSYEQRTIPEPDRCGHLRLVAGPQPDGNGVTIHQQAWMYAGVLEKGNEVTHSLPAEHGIWLHLARGTAKVNGQHIRTGDGLAVENEAELRIQAVDDSELLLFELQ